MIDDANQKPFYEDEASEQEAGPAVPHTSDAARADVSTAAVDNSTGTRDESRSEAIPVEPAKDNGEVTTAPKDAVAESPDPAAASPVDEPRVSSQAAPADKAELSVEAVNASVLADSRKHTRRSFAIAVAAAAAGYGLYHWLDHLPPVEMQPEAYRRAFEANAEISRTIFEDRGLTPTYPLSKAENLRVNGVYGLKKMLEPESYRLQLVGSDDPMADPRYSHDVTSWDYVYIDEKTMEDQGHDTKTPPPSARTSEKMPPESMLEEERQRENRGDRLPRGKEEAGESRSTLAAGTPGLLLTMDDILRLPRHELVTEFKCIEGWSQIVHWAGVSMADFLDAFPPALIDGKEPKYVYMETPDGDFYNGYDLHVCRHPQTLLVTEMMGAPLTQYHGAPLRLHMPTKYGYKQIKRIGLISYTNSKPDDYWTKLGYDWYGGL